MFNQTTSLDNLMYYLLDQQENWDIHELNFSCDFPQNNHLSQIYAIIRLPWLHSKELHIVSHLTFFSYKEDMLQIWSRSDE